MLSTIQRWFSVKHLLLSISFTYTYHVLVLRIYRHNLCINISVDSYVSATMYAFSRHCYFINVLMQGTAKLRRRLTFVGHSCTK